jgi:hypothetical protein
MSVSWRTKRPPAETGLLVHWRFYGCVVLFLLGKELVLSEKELMRLAADECVRDLRIGQQLPTSLAAIWHLLKMHHVVKNVGLEMHIQRSLVQAGALSVSEPPTPTDRALDGDGGQRISVSQN